MIFGFCHGNGGVAPSLPLVGLVQLDQIHVIGLQPLELFLVLSHQGRGRPVAAGFREAPDFDRQEYPLADATKRNPSIRSSLPLP